MSPHVSLPRPLRQRFARQLVLPEFGPEGQAALLAGSALIVGAGGLGTPVASYLVRAGIGRLTILDPAEVDLPDLHRQVLYGQGDVGRSKADVAVERLREIGGPARIEGVTRAFAARDARERVRSHGVVVDASDNALTRYLVSDACVLERRDLVFGAVSRLEGQVAVLAGADRPCYRCLHPLPAPEGATPSCAEVGVLGPVAGIVASTMAFEALCLLSGSAPERPAGLLHLDLGLGRHTRIALAKRADCPICGEAPVLRDVLPFEEVSGSGEPYPGP